MSLSPQNGASASKAPFLSPTGSRSHRQRRQINNPRIDNIHKALPFPDSALKQADWNASWRGTARTECTTKAGNFVRAVRASYREHFSTEYYAREGSDMLWTIFVILVVLWLLGVVSSYTLGGYIHLLLVLAIAVVLIRVIQGRRPVA
jgi:Family of unknown function (DUF5670)